MNLIDYKKYKQLINSIDKNNYIIFYSSELFKIIKTKPNDLKFLFFEQIENQNAENNQEFTICFINFLYSLIKEDDSDSKTKINWILEQLKTINFKEIYFDYKDNIIQALIEQSITLFKNNISPKQNIIFYFDNLIALDNFTCFVMRKLLDTAENLKFAVIFNYSMQFKEITNSQYTNFCFRLNYILEICIMMKLWDKTIYLINILLRMVKYIKSAQLIGLIYFKAGMIYSRQGLFAKAKQYYFKAEKIFKQIDDKDNWIKSLNSLGNIYVSLEKFSIARDYFYKALCVAEENQDDYSLGVTYGSMGNIELKLNNILEAIDYLKKSILFNFRSGFFHNIHYVYNHLGLAYLKLNDIDKAKEYLLTALNFTDTLGSKIDSGNNRLCLAELYIKIANYQMALMYLQSAEKNYSSLKNKYGLMMVYEKFGKLYELQNNKQTAITYYQKAMDIAQELANTKFLKIIQKKLKSLIDNNEQKIKKTK